MQTGRQSKNIAVVGASGAVGIEILRVLERRHFPVRSLRLLASARSAGQELSFRGEPLTIEELNPGSFAGIDLALFSAGASISREFAPVAVREGAIVVDNSSAFRLDPEVPLVVPEINAETAAQHCGILANPNCTTAITLMALYPLHREFGVTRLFAASYQAVSGSGARAIEELRIQNEAMTKGGPLVAQVYPHPIASNIIPHVDTFTANGYTREEMKLQDEGRKILGLPALRASITCARVPVFRTHSVAVSAEFERPVSLSRAREVLADFPGLVLEDEPAENLYPMPCRSAGRDECAVGRLRRDLAFDNGLAFWVSGDQLLKGAALNAVQIAELL
ncbi:MAG: aspartate-semialdehyde dehydrogenase [Verrucomicrobiia bacterium]